MSADGTGNPPPYIIPIDEAKSADITVYKVHTPFTHQSSNIGRSQIQMESTRPVVQTQTTDPKNKFVSYESYELGRNPGMATCTACQQQVLTNVTYKVGTFVLCCCLIPFFVKFFKDVYHTCPKCNKILHIEKKRCC
ncbi:hypothetical protein DNTS_027292 [Danionella cerebrum]|uniref:LITAF domain-containing protein n=1 Tax=Danionella cerebrum TaxID=2873325 RepID=A0A553R4J2_9TELE|nr:hypothetical protein DNTS_027292 [Danionella translucida]